MAEQLASHCAKDLYDSFRWLSDYVYLCPMVSGLVLAQLVEFHREKSDVDDHLRPLLPSLLRGLDRRESAQKLRVPLLEISWQTSIPIVALIDSLSQDREAREHWRVMVSRLHQDMPLQILGLLLQILQRR